MRYPKPFVLDGKWIVDLRSPWGFGRHYRLGDAVLPEAEAQNLAWARLRELEAEKVTKPVSQLAFQMPGTAPATFAGAVDAWEPLKLAETAEESRSYVRNYANRVRRALGAFTLGQFVDGGGQARLVGFMGAMRDAGEAARTIRNTLNTAHQVLTFCTDEERQWLPFVPRFPRPPKVCKPQYDWIDEGSFRALRARIYEGLKPGQLAGILRYEKIDVAPELYVARRRLYLSVLMYTGVRTADADHWTADDVAPDIGIYIRHGRKTDVQLEQFEMPEPFAEDLRAYLRAAGREHFLPGEPIGGGPWKTVQRALARAASALELSHVNPRILRRSYARKMFQLGYTIKQVAERMGHADVRMLHEIYVRTPRPMGRARSLWRVTVPMTPGPTSAPPRKVLAFGGAANGAAPANDREGSDDNEGGSGE